MTDTIKALREDTEQDLSKLKTDLEKDIERVDGQISELRDDVGASSKNIANIEGRLRGWSTVFVVGTLVVALLGGLGVSEFFQDRNELRKLIRDQKVLNQTAAAATQSILVDKLEAEFDKESSLDDLRRRKDIQEEVKRLAGSIKKVAIAIDDESARSTFYLVGEALGPYVDDNCREALVLLEKVKGSDQGRFIYAYMRGVCLLRTEQPKLADEWLGRAAALTQARRASMAVNVQGAAKLFQFRASKDQIFLDQAVQIFSSVLSRDPDFFPAHFNLACSYAEKKNFDQTLNTLKAAYDKMPNRVNEIVEAIKEDLGRPGERFMEEFVRTSLKVQIQPTDPRFPSQLRTALGF